MTWSLINPSGYWRVCLQAVEEYMECPIVCGTCMTKTSSGGLPPHPPIRVSITRGKGTPPSVEYNVLCTEPTTLEAESATSLDSHFPISLSHALGFDCKYSSVLSLHGLFLLLQIKTEPAWGLYVIATQYVQTCEWNVCVGTQLLRRLTSEKLD